MYLLPQTTLGKVTIALIIAMFLLFALGMNLVGFYVGVTSGNSIPEDMIARPGVALPMLCGFASGVSAFVLGLVDVIKKKDFSILVFFCVAIGAFLTLFLIGEIVSPH